MAKDDEGFEDGVDEDREPVQLGEAAKVALTSLGDDHGAQGELDGMDYTKVKFVGVQFDALETDVKIGDLLTFTVKGRVVGVGDEAMRDGHIRHYAKVSVDSVLLADMNDD